MTVHKPGQGMGSRIGILVLIVLFGMYSAYSWYAAYYNELAAHGGAVSLVGGVVLLLGFAGLAAYTALWNPKSVEFLIDMDIELRKVVWPETQPVFDPKAEAWGATYVVIITVIVFACFIALVDLGLTAVLQNQEVGLFRLLFGSGT